MLGTCTRCGVGDAAGDEDELAEPDGEGEGGGEGDVLTRESL